MEAIFPPKPTHPRELELALDVLGAAAKPREAVYMSAPMTTGKRFVEWHNRVNGSLPASSPEYKDRHQKEVLLPNRRHAQEISAMLRRELGGILIDPTAMEDLPGWTQCDYRAFWAAVIERYVHTVVFVDGWQYSSGCAYEFLTALRIRGVTLDERLETLQPSDGLALLETAKQELTADGQDVTFLECVIQETRHEIGALPPQVNSHVTA